MRWFGIRLEVGPVDDGHPIARDWLARRLIHWVGVRVSWFNVSGGRRVTLWRSQERRCYPFHRFGGRESRRGRVCSTSH